jgi:microcystin-dependent protein
MQAYLGEIRLFSFDFCPQGWMECAGQALQMAEYTELFSLIGNKYGGSGFTSFSLPTMKTTTQHGENVKYFICVKGDYPPRE